MSSGVEHDTDTRDVDAGLWLCTDASEPHYSSVMLLLCSFLKLTSVTHLINESVVQPGSHVCV